MQRLPAVRRAVLAAIAAMSAFAFQTGDAFAARVSVHGKDIANLGFAAGHGERNRVSFSVGAAKALVRDRGARLHAGRGCRARSSHLVVCRATRGQRNGFGWVLEVSLRGGNDRARFARAGHYSGGRVIALGGGGRDRLDARGVRETAFVSGGDGRDRILGSPDGDVIAGGHGPDVLTGGRGDDSLRPDPADGTRADDVVNGGAGEDMVVYRGRSAGVTVDLRRHGHQGVSGENDILRDVEDVEGTNHDDVLVGTDSGSNDLQGDRGHDRIAGLGRDDRVWGGAGADSLAAGRGDDIVLAAGGGTAHAGPGNDQLDGVGNLFGGADDDTVDAGPGRAVCEGGEDTVTVSRHIGPSIDPSCESLTVGGDQGLGIALPIARGDDGLRTTIFCDEEDGRIPICHGTMSVHLGGQLVARGSYSISEGSEPLTLPYTNGGREALGDSPKHVVVTVGGHTFGLTI
jgi:Ca2+-binding RTX toxin-like protein